ncbi:MAG: ATP synthase F0 sector subunit a, partial [uncultured Solirubrobacteraceae bacterium]
EQTGEDLHRSRGLHRRARPARRRRRQRGQERGVPAAERVQARCLGRSAWTVRHQQGGPLRRHRGGDHGLGDGLHRAPHAGQAQPRADARRVGLQPHARQHHAQQHGREHGGEVVSLHRHAVSLHLDLEPHRLHPVSDEHRASDLRLRPRDPLARDLCRDREPVGAARPVDRRLHRLHLRGRPREGPARLPQGPRPEGRHRRHGGLHLLPRAVLEPPASHLAERPVVREHPRRSSHHPVHGRRYRRPAGDRSHRLVDAATRRDPVRLRGRACRDAAGLHLRDAGLDLLRRRRRPRPL